MLVTTKHKQRGANTVLRYELKVKYCGRERWEGYFSVTPLPPPSPHDTVQAGPNKYRAWRMVGHGPSQPFQSNLITGWRLLQKTRVKLIIFNKILKTSPKIFENLYQFLTLYEMKKIKVQYHKMFVSSSKLSFYHPGRLNPCTHYIRLQSCSVIYWDTHTS